LISNIVIIRLIQGYNVEMRDYIMITGKKEKVELAIIMLVLFCVTGQFAKAADKIKYTYNGMSLSSSIIDQSSYRTKGVAANSEVVYLSSHNGAKRTKFVFNVKSTNKKLTRHAEGYLWTGDKTCRYNKTAKSDFGDSLVGKDKGVGEIGSYCTEKVDGKFVAGVTLSGY